ncbi:MAG: hypothetical protein ACK5LT_12055 [Lachnospirales bacterium]
MEIKKTNKKKLKYFFLKDMDKKYNIFNDLPLSIDDIDEVYDGDNRYFFDMVFDLEETKKNIPNYFLIDFLPKSMKNDLVFCKFFNHFHYQVSKRDYHKYFDTDMYLGEDNFFIDKRFEFSRYNSSYYVDAFSKLIFMLIGYDNNVYFETTIFEDIDEFIENHYFPFRKQDYLTNKVFYLNNDTIDLFVYLVDMALKDFVDLDIYFTDLNIIMNVDDLLLPCLIFENFDLISKMATTEGLYVRDISLEKQNLTDEEL